MSFIFEIDVNQQNFIILKIFFLYFDCKIWQWGTLSGSTGPKKLYGYIYIYIYYMNITVKIDDEEKGRWKTEFGLKWKDTRAIQLLHKTTLPCGLLQFSVVHSINIQTG